MLTRKRKPGLGVEDEEMKAEAFFHKIYCILLFSKKTEFQNYEI
jgi:hypothetical protein